MPQCVGHSRAKDGTLRLQNLWTRGHETGHELYNVIWQGAQITGDTNMGTQRLPVGPPAKKKENAINVPTRICSEDQPTNTF